MEYREYVDAEGGPLLIADAAVARAWRGSDGDGADYRRACDAVLAADGTGTILPVGAGMGLAWDTEGPGTTDLFLDGMRLVLVRAWLDGDGEEEAAVAALASVPMKNDARPLGKVDVPSGILIVLWSPESGTCLALGDEAVTEVARPTGEMAVDSGGLLVRVTPGIYAAFHDTAEIANDSARRCHLLPTQSGDAP